MNSSFDTDHTNNSTPPRKISDVSDDFVRTVVDSWFIDDEIPIIPYYEDYYPTYYNDLGGDLVAMAMD